MKIITISREFSSGGRELGKLIAELNGWDYYDREIISEIAGTNGMDEGYVEYELETKSADSPPLSYRRSFFSATPSVRTQLLLEQKKVVEKIPEKGRDCVIVGRNADALLSRFNPFNVFVCADQDTKIARLRRNAPDGEALSDKDALRTLRRIDRLRSQIREIISASPWGEKSAYHLVVNTSGWNLNELAGAIREFAARWFGRSE